MRTPEIIPDGWVGYGRAVAEATMTGASCEVRLPDTHELDDNNQYVTVPGDLVWSGKCRVQRLGPQRITSLAQQQAIFANYLVAIPYQDTDIDVGNIVRVTTSVDGLLVGRSLRVAHVMVGSLVWERDLYCNDDMSEG